MSSSLEWRLVERYAELLKRELGNSLSAVAVFGSLARGEAKFPESDIDVLVVLRSTSCTISGRLKLLNGAREMLRGLDEYSAFISKYGWSPVIQEHVLSEEELKAHPPVLLDMTQHVRILHDSGVLQAELEKLKARLKELGARKVGGFWVLKPDVKAGEAVEL
ncbi:MAG: nucleotidyltransferase domain-containing protein [Candidatus Freyarchaeota archaeon]|nr:nucleotidyltransferase domain-containing protein [Candidatus Jordarchaeia archaeon]